MTDDHLLDPLQFSEPAKLPVNLLSDPMSTTRSILLLGASGFFGPALSSAFGPILLGKTYATRHILGGLQFDVRTSSIVDLIDSLPTRPSSAVVMLGETRIDECARDPKGTDAVNVYGTIRVIRELAALGITPVFLSSDAVFDGSHANWQEDDAARPILTYGRQKLEVERFIKSLLSPWLVVRLPKLLSSQPNSRCMLSQWIDRLGLEDNILCATDQYFSPVSLVDAAQGIVDLMQKQAQGVYHLAGPERLSRRSLLQAALEEYRKFARPKAKIVDCSLRDLPFKEQRPLDTSMNASRFNSLSAMTFQRASDVARTVVRNWFAKPTVT